MNFKKCNGRSMKWNREFRNRSTNTLHKFLTKVLKKFNGGATDNFLTSGLINCGVFLKPHSTTEITTATHNNIMNLTMIVKSSPI